MVIMETWDTSIESECDGLISGRLATAKMIPAISQIRERRVQVYFETPAESRVKSIIRSSPTDFPLPDTQWTRYYLSENEELTPEPPEAERGSDSFQVAVGRGDDVDGVHYVLDFDKATAICGPVAVSLWAAMHDDRYRPVRHAGGC